MFYALNIKAFRWWLVGLVAGLVGWGLWTALGHAPGPGIPMAFERNFAPAPASVPALSEEGAPKATPAEDGGGTDAAVATVPEAAPERAPAASPREPVVGRPGATWRADPNDFRAERERLRSQEMETVQRILDDPKASEARKAEAQGQLLKLLERSRREIEVEQLLQSAGIPDPVVSIGESGVQVVVPQPLSAQGAARIGELVARMAGVRRENISIIDSLTAFGGGRAWEESGAGR
ncbi:SpoIIIAH-like family protein [Carboxydochorda subterranea]|uniref:SpoIIIAH-like family protein n=1 Tax=Carboxydichorda subterranea TaxID=3109565 RepID=A0ABZ1BZR1_9FIRM|nr:SpoIIIAH-like family protein [Limnochorda sp. L945t]WRP18325.1 SpoIIIAH-like family protein [Limnochorda sp. L945t]